MFLNIKFSELTKVKLTFVDRPSLTKVYKYLKINMNMDAEDIEYIRKHIKHFRFLRDDCIDEIPDRIVHSTDGDYKCRGAWFGAFEPAVYQLRHRGLVSEDFAEEAVRLVTEYSANRERNNDLTTREDIDKVNGFLTRIIDNLEEKIKKEL